MFTALLEKVVRHEDLTADEAAAAMREVMEGRAAPAQLAALLSASSMKGERPAEIVGFARTMREHAVKLQRAGAAMCSTRAAPAAIGPARSTFRRPPRSSSRRAACRSPSMATARSRAGAVSADVFEALGVNIDARRRSSSAPARSRDWRSSSRRPFTRR